MSEKKKSQTELEHDKLDQMTAVQQLELRKRKMLLMERYSLTSTEALLCLAYTGRRGDIRQAAEAAGINYDYARRVIVRPHVKKCIQEQHHMTEDEILARIEGSILTRQDLQLMWSEIASDPHISEKGRLKASELLAKSEIMLVDKTVHEGGAVPLSLKLSKPSVKERIASLLGKDQEDEDDFLN